MKIPDLSIFKKYSQTPVLKNCLNCKRVKPAAQLEKDVFCAKPALQKIETTVYNPYTSQMQSGTFNIDLKSLQSLSLTALKELHRETSPLLCATTPKTRHMFTKKSTQPKTGLKSKK